MKNILVPYFTQSGQLKQILDHFLQPLMDAGHQVEFLNFNTVHKFPFPWITSVFFDTVPESVNGTPTLLEPWHTKLEQYDLIILGWQPWNLSPSIPFSSFIQDEKARKLLKNTPVITISGCRNMWITAQEKNKKLLLDAGAHLVGNIVLHDKHLNHISYFTILHWMSTGKKTRKWGIFPKPGVSDDDIKNTSQLGALVVTSIEKNNFADLQNRFIHAGAVPVTYPLMYIERKAGIIFQKWVNLINKYPKKRKQILFLYRQYITIALLVASPIILLINTLFLRLVQHKRNKRLMNYYRSVDFKKDI